MIERAIKNFTGQMPTLEGAIGAWFVGKEIGWKPMYLIHEKRTRTPKVSDSDAVRIPFHQ